MAETSYLQSNFLGGEWSLTYQGRMDDPHYRTALAVCRNAFPTEQGSWTRRSGTQFLQTTRGGAPGRVISFDVSETNPYVLEFTDFFLRFFAFKGNKVSLVTTNDTQTVTAISADNPAKVTVASAWPTGSSISFSNLGTNNPLLQNRVFKITNISGTQFSLQDSITGANIDGATLGTFVSGTVSRILEFATPYQSGHLGSWQDIISIQAETQAIFVNGIAPEVLTMVTPPTPGTDATFTLAPVLFRDGPYLDPFNGSICTYDVLSGNVTLTFSFLAWSATVSYSLGDYVLSVGQGYRSLQNANLNHAPAGSPTFWVPINGGAPVGSNGFTGADIGRHIRLFSEPPPWAVGATYALDAVVKYNGGYWISMANGNIGIIPGTDVTKWLPVTGAQYAVWTWGRIISVSGTGLITPVVAIGNMTGGGGLAAAFDGAVSKTLAASAQLSGSAVNPANWAGQGVPYNAGTQVYFNANIYTANHTFTEFSTAVFYPVNSFVEYQGNYYVTFNTTAGPGNFFPPNWLNLGPATPTNTNMWSFVGPARTITIDAYAGQDFHLASKAIQYATVFPGNDQGFVSGPFSYLTINLRAKASAPLSPSDGTLLGTTTISSDSTGAVTIVSNDQTTTWNYFWIEMNCVSVNPGNFTQIVDTAQVEFFTPNIANGSVITIQLAGPPLLYVAGTVINTWRAGLFSNTSGWPTCGCYHEGRLWLAGAASNRIDGSQSNDIFNFAPTGPDGTVADNNGISYIFNAKGVNTIFWATSHLQGIVLGTDGAEWLIQATTAGLPLTPFDIQAHPATNARCARIEPVHCEHTLVVVQRLKRKVLEFFPDVFSGKFTIPHLTERARHLTGELIEEIRYQQELNPIIWARLGDGSFIGCTYRRDTLMTSQGPNFYGWHEHDLGSNRLVEGITVGPSQDGSLDALIMVTNDLSTNVRHIELLTDFFEETDNYQNAWLLDDAVTPSSYQISGSNLIINGLWHLNGKLVTVFAAGLDCGDFTVASGSITVPFGDGISAGTANGLFTAAFVNSFGAGNMPLVVGFTYTSDGQLLRPIVPAESGSRAGPGFAKKRRNHMFGIQAIQTNSVSIGTSFTKLDPVAFRSDAQASFPLPQLFSGVLQDRLRDDYSFDGQICWRITRPVPALIAAIGGMVMTQDV